MLLRQSPVRGPIHAERAEVYGGYFSYPNHMVLKSFGIVCPSRAFAWLLVNAVYVFEIKCRCGYNPVLYSLKPNRRVAI